MESSGEPKAWSWKQNVMINIQVYKSMTRVIINYTLDGKTPPYDDETRRQFLVSTKLWLLDNNRIGLARRIDNEIKRNFN